MFRLLFRKFLVINGINTAINTDGDIPTRIVCGIIEGGATMASGYICNKWTGDVELTTKAYQVIANAAVGYTVGQTAELAAIGFSAAAKSGANASTEREIAFPQNKSTQAPQSECKTKIPYRLVSARDRKSTRLNSSHT